MLKLIDDLKIYADFKNPVSMSTLHLKLTRNVYKPEQLKHNDTPLQA